MDNLETKLNNTNSQKITRRSVLGTVGRGLLTLFLAAYIPIATACGGHTTPPPTQKVKMVETVNAEYFALKNVVRSSASGTVNYISDDGAINKTGNIGEALDLGELDQGASKTFKVIVNANNSLPQTHKNVAVSGTHIRKAVIIDLSKFSPQTRLALIPSGVAWNQSSMDVVYGVNEGRDVSSGFRSVLEPVITDYANNVNYSITKSPTFTDGSFDVNAQPPNGKVWCFHDPNASGMRNACYPYVAGKLLPNMDDISLAKAMAADEFYDMLVPENINDATTYPHYKEAFSHASLVLKEGWSNYSFTTSGESMDGFPSGSTTAASQYVMMVPLNSPSMIPGMGGEPEYERVEMGPRGAGAPIERGRERPMLKKEKR